MMTVDEAIEAILARTSPLPARMTPLAEALGLVLAEEIIADIDLPPFDKALMDGYAVRSADLPSSDSYSLRVVGEISAGMMPDRALEAGESARIMTGAPLPQNADAVVMVERSKLDGSSVTLPGPVAPGLNRLIRGREMKAGEVLLTRGTRLDPTRIGLAASAGRAKVLAVPRPSVAVQPTGDELVAVEDKPRGGQIRNSNGSMLASLARGWGATNVVEQPIARDDPKRLRASLEASLSACDVLLVSGGVSAGARDLVPATLTDLAIEPIFHKVNVKPGKPLWFGVGPDRGSHPGTLVFGLPGNPVSGVVSFLLFVRPALEALAGSGTKRTQLASFCLGKDFAHRGDRPTFQPARLEDDQLIPLEWAGSADLRTVALADGFAAFPAGDRVFVEGEFIPFLPK